MNSWLLVMGLVLSHLHSGPVLAAPSMMLERTDGESTTRAASNDQLLSTTNKHYKGNQGISDDEARQKMQKRINDTFEQRHLERKNGPGNSDDIPRSRSIELPGTSGGKSGNSGNRSRSRSIESPGTSGGGNVLVSNEDTNIVYLADTFKLFKTTPALKDLLKQYNLPDLWEEAARLHFNSLQPGFGDLVLHRLRELRFIFWTTMSNDPAGSLPLLEDDQIQVEEGWTKHQLAVQDMVTGVVAVDPNLFHKLSLTEQFLFKFHEALISLQKTKENTTPIRAEIAGFLSNPNLESVLHDILKLKFIEVPVHLRAVFQMNLFLVAGDTNFLTARATTPVTESAFPNFTAQCNQSEVDGAITFSTMLTMHESSWDQEIPPYVSSSVRFTGIWMNCVQHLLNETKSIRQLSTGPLLTSDSSPQDQDRALLVKWTNLMQMYDQAKFYRYRWKEAMGILDLTPIQAAFFLAAQAPARAQYVLANDYPELATYLHAANAYIQAAKMNGQLEPAQITELESEVQQFVALIYRAQGRVLQPLNTP